MDEQDAEEDEAGAGEVVPGPGDGRQAVLWAARTVRGAQNASPPAPRLPWLRSITPNPNLTSALELPVT